MSQYISYKIEKKDNTLELDLNHQEFREKVNGLSVTLKNNYVRFNGSSDLIAKVKLNSKYLIYDKETAQTIKSDLPIKTILEVATTPIGNYIVYVGRNHSLSFIKTFAKDKDINRVVELNEARPLYNNKVFNLLGSFRIVGFLRTNQKEIDSSSFFVSTEQDSEKKYKTKFLFSDKIRKKFENKNARIFRMFSLYSVSISHKELYESYLKNSEINIPLYYGVSDEDSVNQDVSGYFIMKERHNSKKNEENHMYTTRSMRVKNTDTEMFIRKKVNSQFVIVVTDYLKKSIYIKETIGKVISKLKGKKDKAIYFEKFADGADESAYQLFEYAMERKDEVDHTNVYIMNEENDKYKEVKAKYPNNVFPKNSIKSFENIFSAKYFVSSDLSSHIQRRLYDNSKWLKESILNTEKIFLQHGPSLCTNVFARGYFSSMTLFSPKKIIVCSQMEKDLFLKNTYYKDEQLLLTGFPNFDNYVRHRKSNPVQESITFMLTWRPWDLTGVITEGSYINRYLTFISLMKEDSFFENKKINIILHPKAKLVLETQFVNEYHKIEEYLYEGNIKDALMESSVTVTDYSSIMFYAFSGGSNVIYYWQDKARAEAEYGSPNIMQEPIAFGDIVYSLEDIISEIKSNYGKKQKEEYIIKYNNLIDCRFDDNTKNTFEALFIKNKRGE